jgi:hypothetical protein
MSKNSEYVSSMQARMKKFDQEVTALGVEATDKARAAYEERIKELRASRDSAHATLAQLQVASESAGTKMHAGMTAAWDTMQAALRKASADLKKKSS